MEGADEVLAGPLALCNDGPLVAARVGVGLELALEGAGHHKLEAQEAAQRK